MVRKGQVSSQESRERELIRQSEAKTKKHEEELIRKMRKAKKKEKEREKKRKQKEKEKEKLNLAGTATADQQPKRPVLVKRPPSLLERMLADALTDHSEDPRRFSRSMAATAIRIPTPTPTREAASLPQILGMLAETLRNAAGTAAAPTPGSGPTSLLQILLKLAESINQIVLPEEPLLTAPPGPAPTTGPASHQQILHRLAESISQIVPPEEPKEIIPPSVSAHPATVPDEELEAREFVRQARIEAIKYELELVRKDSLKKRIFCPPLQRCPNPGPQPVRQSQLAYKQNDTVIPDEAVIAFVEEMDRAYQYFKFQDYIRVQPDINYHSDPDDITCKLTKMFRSSETNNFSLLDMNEIWRSVKHYVLQLRLKYRGSQNTDSAFQNPVFSLIFQTRQKCYALDENPREELKKLRARAPLFYHDTLVCRKPTLEPEARRVIVSNVSNDASEKDFWDLFCTSGDIEYLECQRTEAGQIACITFKRVGGAKHAQTYTGREVPHVVCIKGSPLVVELKPVEDAVVKKAVDVESMLAKAVDRYRELWWSFQSKDEKNVET